MKRSLSRSPIQMPVNIRTLCQRLELHLDRSNFQIGNKRVNDAPLLSRAAKQEVDGNHLYNLNVWQDQILKLFLKMMFKQFGML